MWPKVRLGEVVRRVERPEAPKPGAIYRQLGVKLWGEGAYERERMDGGATKYATLSRVCADDVVVNKIWARNGSVAVVQPQLNGCFVSGEFPTFAACIDKVLPRWMHWLTKTPDFWRQCDEKSQGTSGKNRIKPEQFLNVEIPLPPLPEQRRIVARIEALAAQIAATGSLRQQAGEEAESLCSAARSAACLGTSSRVIPLGEIIGQDVLRNGKSVKSAETGDGIRCLTLSAMRNGRIDMTCTKSVPLTSSEARPYLAKQDDVFIVRGNGSKDLCGLAGRVEKEEPRVVFPDLFIKVPLPADRFLPEFFVAVWNSPATRAIIEDKAKTTSGIWKINQGHILATPIPVPPLPEQRRIVAHLDRVEAQVDALKHLQSETAAELAALLPAVLDRAFKQEL
jgi:type I restriction enzyme, S subunit